LINNEPSETEVYHRLERIKSRLLKYPGKLISDDSLSKDLPKAAVSLILRPSPKENEIFLFLVRRRTFATDPWSGQMALPGGKHVKEDSDLLATVIREVLEETGIDLRSCSMIGSLDELLPGNATIRVLPYVAVSPENLDVSINESEIESYVWIPLSFFEDEKNLWPYSVAVRGMNLTVNAYTYRDRETIWGMTLRIIQDFLGKINYEKD
jgi:8-oxo-dGTP diphosphatase